MRYVVVLPWIVEDYKTECLAGCKLDNMLMLDNSTVNRGVMRSHNEGIDHMRALDADWLIVLSAAIRFGDAGGRDFVRALEHCSGHAVVNAEGVYGWHLIAFARDTIEAAGRWDENFSPYGWDDVDYSIRVRKALPDGVWSGIKALDLGDTIMGHSIKLGGVEVDNEHHLAYFASKWGAPVGSEFDDYYDRPFNNADAAVGYWPSIGDGRWNEAVA